MKNGLWKRGCSLLLAFVLTVLGIAGILPTETYAASGIDVGIIGLTVNDDNTLATATLYGYGNDTNADVAFYVDGVKKSQTSGVSVGRSQSVSVHGSISLPGSAGEKHYVTAVINASGDTNYSNNNRTTIINPNGTSGGGTQPDRPEVTAPGAVTNLTATATSANSVTLNWTAPADAADVTYIIKQNGTVIATGILGTTYAVTGLTAGTTYNFSVTAVRSGKSSVEIGSSATTPKEQGKLAVSAINSPAERTTIIKGNPCNIEAVIKNIVENSEAVSGEITISVDGQTKQTIISNALAGGAVQTIQYSLDTADIDVGEHTITVKVGDSELTKTVMVEEKKEEYGLANLIVTDIKTDPENPVEGQPVTFIATVRNIGTATLTWSGGGDGKQVIGVSFSVNNSSDTTWHDQYSIPLKPGGEVELKANGGVKGSTWTFGAAGTYNVTAWVDDNGRINESDKTDNKLTKTISVAEQSSEDVAEGTVKVFGIPDGKSRSNGISVTVDNKEVGVFDTRVNNSRFWARMDFENIPTGIFEFKSKQGVKIKVTKDGSVNAVTIRPASAGITYTTSTENGKTVIEFTLKEQGSYTVEFNNSSKGALQLFANPVYEKEAGTTYTVNGRIDGLSVPDDAKVYLPGGSIVYGKFDMGSNSKIYGSGVIEDTGRDNSYGIGITKKDNVTIKGVTYLNAADWDRRWNVEVASSSNIHFNYFHIIAASRNSDGISIQSSDNITIDHSYLRTWDDGVVLKNYYETNTHDVTVTNSVFWTDLAQSMEIGAETNKQWNNTYNGDPRIYAVRFENIDVIHAFHKPAISIHNMDNAKIYDIIWKNIRIEDAQMGNNKVIQVNRDVDGAHVEANVEDGWPLLIDITNVKGGEVPGTAGGWTRQQERGSISDVTLEDISVTSWANNSTDSNGPGVWVSNKAPGIRMLNSLSGGSILNIKLKNIKIGGIKVTNDIIQTSFNSCIGGWGSAPSYTVE